MNFYCTECGQAYPIDGLHFMCRCGGLFALEKTEGEEVARSVSLGEVHTPVVKRRLQGMDVWFKIDYLMPTGSFKDRGAATLVSQLKTMGIQEVVEDSSGNAGAAIAGYCAAAGIRCHIYLPESTSPGKIKQIASYGAEIVKVAGTRDDTARAVRAAANNIYYASHVYNPLFFAGTKSLAFEIANQIGIPDSIVVPAGNGTMLLGAYIGFAELGKIPKIIAVQSANCAPLYARFHGTAVHYSSTAAEGIAIQSPARLAEMIRAVTASGGDLVVVTDDEILNAQQTLHRMGLYIEPTAGVAVAGWLKYYGGGRYAGEKIVVPLTGSGLKK